MSRSPKLRTCNCCGMSRTTTWYSYNHKRKDFSPTCRDCGAWLFLLRQVFGEARNMDRVRERQRLYEREKYRRLKNKPANDLYAAWGIGKRA